MSIAILLLAAAAAIASINDAPVQERARLALKLDLYACPRPAFPPPALAQGVGGAATLALQIDAEGRVSQARIASSSGRADLDAAALAGVRRCVFHAVAATAKTPDGWHKARFAWIPGAPRPTPDADRVAKTQALAEGGDPAAQNNLGVLYHRGDGLPRDRQQALYWYAKAAAQGHGWAQANLSWDYQYGPVEARDMDQARLWLTRSAEGGLAAAQVRLGLMLLERAVYNVAKAPGAQWFERAAATNDAAGLYYLGRSYELGVGNERDDARAAALYRRALGRSGGRAETALATMIETGRAQAAAPDEALTFYETAMRSRDGAAFYRYGLVLEGRGDAGLAAAAFRHGQMLGDCRAAVRSIQIRAGWTPRVSIRPVSVEQCPDRLEPTPQSWRELY